MGLGVGVTSVPGYTLTLEIRRSSLDMASGLEGKVNWASLPDSLVQAFFP